MKEMFILLMMFMGVINISAQEINESQKIDSLLYKLDKLQLDYDYFYCESELNRFCNELKIHSNNFYIRATQILIEGYSGEYNDEYYRSAKRNYGAAVDLFESYKTNLYSKIKLISRKIEGANFHELEIQMLKLIADSIDQGLKHAQSTLDYYKGVLDAYKKMDR